MNKDDIIALAGTIIVHLILLFLLYLGIIKTLVPDEDSGILVNFGNVSASSGMFEPQYSASAPQREIPTPSNPRPQTAVEKELITQNTEESVAVPEKKETKKETVVDENAKRIREEAERKRLEDAEKKRKEEEQRQLAESISNRADNAFGMGNTQDAQNQGDAATGTGNQGSPFGNADTGANTGTGGFGTFNLNGRSIGRGGLPRPSYTSQEEGRIVIDITVNPEGNVISAEIGKGTNIDNATMRKSAIDAARRAKFNKIQGNNQSGTITYIYKLM